LFYFDILVSTTTIVKTFLTIKIINSQTKSTIV